MDGANIRPLTDEEFEQEVQTLVDEAMQHIDSKIRGRREDAWARYYGKVVAKPQNGGTDIVVRSIQDAVGAIVPQLLGVFSGADAVVEFLPGSTVPFELELCRAANLSVTSEFWTGEGWLSTNDAVMEAVISGYGFCKCYIQETIEQDFVTEELQEEEILALQQGGLEVRPAWDVDDPDDENYGLYNIVKDRVKKEIKIEAVPASNMLWTYAPCLTESWLVGQVTEVRIGDLVEMGFTPDEIGDTGSKTRQAQRVRQEEDARENYSASSTDKRFDSTGYQSWASQRTSYFELFVKVDKDGDGLPERYKVWMAGDNKRIMRHRRVKPTDMPFILVPAYRIPHSTYSESVADRTAEFQEAETRMLRAQIDLSEMIAGPMILNATGGGVDANKLANWKSYKVIDCRSPEAVKWLIPPDIGASLLATSQELKMRREDRTGVSRIGSSLRPEDMADVQATVAKEAGASSELKIEYLARLQAELALKPLMKRILMLQIEMGQVNVPYMGQVVTIDTSKFNPNWKLRVKVGLGTGTRLEKSATMMALWQALTQVCMQMGPENDITNTVKLANLIYDFGTMQQGMNVSRYVNDPNEAAQIAQQRKQQPPPPDPAMEKVKGELQIAQQKVQGQQQIQQARIIANAQNQQAKTAAQQQQAVQKLMLDKQNAEAKLQQEFELELTKLMMEHRVDMVEAEYDREVGMEQARHPLNGEAR